MSNPFRLTSEASYSLILVIIFIGTFAGNYNLVSLNVALPGFVTVFNVSMQHVQWIVTAFNLAAGVVIPVANFVIQRFGIKQTFIYTLTGISISSLLCSMSWGIESLIAFRVIQGLFCGLLQPISLAMIYMLFPKEKQAFALSIWSFATVFATSIGPTLSGWLLMYNWHYIFLVTVPIGTLIIIIAIICLPRVAAVHTETLDWIGLISVTIGSFCLLLFFGNMSTWSFLSLQAQLTLWVGLIGITFFVIWQFRTAKPLLHLRLILNPIFAISLLISICITFGLYAGVYFVPFYLVEIKHLSTFHAGLVFMPAAVLLSCATLLNSFFYRYVTPAKLLLIGGTLLLATTYVLSELTLATSIVFVIMILAVRNFGTGISINPSTTISMSVIPKAYVASASTIITWLRQVMSAVVLGINTSIFNYSLNKNLLHYDYNASTSNARQIFEIAYLQSINDALKIAVYIMALTIPLTLVIIVIQAYQHRKEELVATIARKT